MLRTERLVLHLLEPAMAEEMAVVLADPDLFRHTGGAPPGVAELAERYERQAAGWSDDRSEQWMNWIIRRADTGVAVGYVQATIRCSERSAELAWVVGKRHQGNGFATEAASAVVEWLRRREVTRITAHIGRANRASQAVARKLGLRPTAELVDDETVWELPPG